MPAVFLPDRALLLIGGADAQSFLQGLITTDVADLPEGAARPGALLTPQGKILFDFLIWRHADGFMLETDAAMADAFSKRLTMYKLRAAVTLARQASDGVTVSWDDDGAEGVVDDRFARAGLRLTRWPGPGGSDDRDLYEALRVAHGIAQSGVDYALQDAFPHDVLLDLNGGLSFRKGCYIGQEVVSRMQHRSTARRRVTQLSAQAALPQPGTEISVGGKPIGTLGTVAGHHGLAILRIDKAGAALAAGEPILAGSVPVTPVLPDWSGLSFPAESDEASA